MIKSRFDGRIYFYLLAGTAASFLLSLFLLQLFVGLLAVLWIFEKVEAKRKAVDVLTYLILTFGLIRIISILFSQYPAVSVQSFYKDALFYLGFLSISFYLKVMEYEKLKSILNYFTIAAVAVALIGLVLFNLSVVERAQSFGSGYSTFSSYLIAALGVMIAVPVSVKFKHVGILRDLALALVLAGVITSLGRTNLFIAVMLVLAGVFFRKIKIKDVVIVALLAAVLSGISFFNNRTEVQNRVENPTTLSDRDILMKGVETLKFDHPLLGFGPRTFHQIFPYKSELNDKGIGSWHNDFIQVYFESGLLGLLSFVAIIIFAVYYAFKFLRMNKKTNPLYDVVFGMLLGFIALVLSAVTAGFIDSPVLSVVFAFLISLLSAAHYHQNNLNEA